MGSKRREVALYCTSVAPLSSQPFRAGEYRSQLMPEGRGLKEEVRAQARATAQG